MKIISGSKHCTRLAQGKPQPALQTLLSRSTPERAELLSSALEPWGEPLRRFSAREPTACFSPTYAIAMLGARSSHGCRAT